MGTQFLFNLRWGSNRCLKYTFQDEISNWANRSRIMSSPLTRWFFFRLSFLSYCLWLCIFVHQTIGYSLPKTFLLPHSPSNSYNFETRFSAMDPHVWPQEPQATINGHTCMPTRASGHYRWTHMYGHKSLGLLHWPSLLTSISQLFPSTVTTNRKSYQSSLSRTHWGDHSMIQWENQYLGFLAI